MPSTHALSHGAGQIRPVNSGKLFVEERMSYASLQFFLYTASLNSGITLPNGQPLRQKGTPQFMQRPDCWFNFSALYFSTNSLKSFRRSCTGRLDGNSLVNSKNPVVLPIV